MAAVPLTAEQIECLLNSLRLVNSTLDLEQLLHISVREINRNLNADRSTLFLVDEEKGELWSTVLLGDESLEIRLPLGKGIAGQVACTGEVVNLTDAYLDKRFNPEVDRKSGYRTRSLLTVPVHDKTGKIIGVIQCLNKKSGPFDQRDVQFLLAFAEHIAIAIQNAWLYQEALERKRLEEEMAVAAEIQNHLLPKRIPRIPGYEIFAAHKPARSIGGDYFDFFQKESRLYFILVDVSGKGIPAALLMANLHATFHAWISKPLPLNQIVQNMNQHLVTYTTDDKFATLLLGCLDTQRHTLSYVNAGHVPPIHTRCEGKRVHLEELTTGGIPAGMLADAEYAEGQLVLKPGDTLLMCSDGVTEACDPEMNFFGSQRLHRFLRAHWQQPAQEQGTALLKAVGQFCQDNTHQDDLTLIIFKRMRD